MNSPDPSKVWIDALLSFGADPNAVDAEGWTPLHCACRAANTAAVESLLQSPEIEIDAVNLDGHTAWDLAKRRGGRGRSPGDHTTAICDIKRALVDPKTGKPPSHHGTRLADWATMTLLALGCALAAPVIAPVRILANATCTCDIGMVMGRSCGGKRQWWEEAVVGRCG